MPIKLEEDRILTPSVKFQSIGQFAMIAVAYVDTLPVRAFGETEQKINSTGKPVEQTRIRGIVVKGDAVLNKDESHVTIQKGDVVALYLKGQSRFAYFEAKKKLGRALECGDLVYWKWAGEEKGNKPSPMKVFEIQVKSHDDPKRVEECEALYHRINGTSDEDDASEQHSQSSASNGDYDPFLDLE
jgi:hypothetical protein